MAVSQSHKPRDQSRNVQHKSPYLACVCCWTQGQHDIKLGPPTPRSVLYVLFGVPMPFQKNRQRAGFRGASYVNIICQVTS